MKYSFAVFMMLIAGCASKQPCPTESEVPISSCRAENECGKGSFGLATGLIFSGIGSGMSHQPNQAQQNYNQCVRNNLDAQKFNAATDR